MQYCCVYLRTFVLIVYAHNLVSKKLIAIALTSHITFFPNSWQSKQKPIMKFKIFNTFFYPQDIESPKHVAVCVCNRLLTYF